MCFFAFRAPKFEIRLLIKSIWEMSDDLPRSQFLNNVFAELEMAILKVILTNFI